MKWLIKNPAPIGPRLTTWGDYHFTRSLARYLVELGEEVDTDFDPEWYNDKLADVVLVLRGKHQYEVPEGSSAVHVMWNISHPEDIAIEEYNRYDLVFIASMAHTARIRPQAAVPVAELLQCTDTEECYPPPQDQELQRTGYVFVGNSRDAERPGVIWAVELGFPIRIWGNMWNKFVDKRFVVAKNLPGEERGGLYRKSKATINDHWPDMKEYGFVNDRCFDALACGLPIISDYHEELARLFPDEILYYRDRAEFEDCLREMLLNYPEIKRRVDGLRDRVLREFSFKARARTLVDAVRRHKGLEPLPEG